MPDQTTAFAPELGRELDEFKRTFLPTLPPEVSATLLRGIDDLVRSGIDRHSLKVGDVAPDFTLPSARAEEVNLYRLLSQGPAVIAFYRGAW